MVSDIRYSDLEAAISAIKETALFKKAQQVGDSDSNNDIRSIGCVATSLLAWAIAKEGHIACGDSPDLEKVLSEVGVVYISGIAEIVNNLSTKMKGIENGDNPKL